MPHLPTPEWDVKSDVVRMLAFRSPGLDVQSTLRPCMYSCQPLSQLCHCLI